MNNMLSLEEVRHYLDVEQAELEKYLKQGKLRAYKIGGTYLRFRKEEVFNLRSEIRPSYRKPAKQGPVARAAEFWRFNNFYVISILVVAALAYMMIRL